MPDEVREHYNEITDADNSIVPWDEWTGEFKKIELKVEERSE